MQVCTLFLYLYLKYKFYHDQPHSQSKARRQALHARSHCARTSSLIDDFSVESQIRNIGFTRSKVGYGGQNLLVGGVRYVYFHLRLHMLKGVHRRRLSILHWHNDGYSNMR
mgnify:CR=1 FL=1